MSQFLKQHRFKILIGVIFAALAVVSLSLQTSKQNKKPRQHSVNLSVRVGSSDSIDKAKVVKINCQKPVGQQIANKSSSVTLSDQQASATCKRFVQSKLPQGDYLCRQGSNKDSAIKIEGIMDGRKFSGAYSSGACSSNPGLWIMAGQVIGTVSSPQPLPKNLQQRVMILPASDPNERVTAPIDSMPENQRWYMTWPGSIVPKVKSMEQQMSNTQAGSREYKMLSREKSKLLLLNNTPPCSITVPQSPYEACNIPTSSLPTPLKLVSFNKSQLESLMGYSSSEIISVLARTKALPPPPGWPGYVAPKKK